MNVVSLDEQKMQTALQLASQGINAMMKQLAAEKMGWVFVTMIPGRTGFVSNVAPENMLKAFGEVAARIEQLKKAAENGRTDGTDGDDDAAVGEGDESGSVSGDAQDDASAQKAPSLLVSPGGTSLARGRVMEDERSAADPGGDESDAEDETSTDEDDDRGEGPTLTAS